MLKCFVKLTGVMCSMGLFFACSNANNKPLSIDFSSDSTKIVISHIDRTGLLELKNSSKGDSSLNEMLSVLQTPSEQDSAIREEPIAGKVMLTDSNIVFVPAQPFVKGRDYLVITHLNIRFGGVEEIVKGKVSYSIKPQQKFLKR
ncbi:hypothetical protein SAMN05421820_1103 [Pedobacter steynii]|uniref:Lipoprotein n=1 Tax=Pedobacter steynii TaxID=430522 RepID=A0A1H0EWY6_9SPHI|nr:hypothetical protein [Pedobacter steynii]NQX42279.1 hypothetical protein [Pedobacter steynii]SDN86816.1 hypothetical protein SAMN05421820_1103 [Pedobacter steynii]